MSLDFDKVGLNDYAAGCMPEGFGVNESIKVEEAIVAPDRVGGQPLFAASGNAEEASTASQAQAAIARKVSITLSGVNDSATKLTFTGGSDTTEVTIAPDDTAEQVAEKVVTAVNGDSGAKYTAENEGSILIFTAKTAGTAANNETVSIAVTDDGLSAGEEANAVTGSDAVVRKFIGVLCFDKFVGNSKAGQHLAYRRHGQIYVKVNADVKAWDSAYLDSTDKFTNVSEGSTDIKGVFRSNAASGGIALLELL